MGIIPTADVSATDEVIDAIADIEMQRQAMEKEAGLAVSCNSALRKLHELLDREKVALQLHVSGTGHPVNVDAVMIEVERVKKLAIVTGRGHLSRNNVDRAGLRQELRQKSWQNAQRNPARNKGRRTMGRAGGR